MKNFGFNFDGDRENATVQLTIRSALDDSTSPMPRELHRSKNKANLTFSMRGPIIGGANISPCARMWQ